MTSKSLFLILLFMLFLPFTCAGNVTFRVYDAKTANPLENVTLTLTYSNITNTTTFDYNITITLPDNELIEVTVTKDGYQQRTLMINSSVNLVDIYLDPQQGNLTFLPPTFEVSNITPNITMDDIMGLFSKWPGGKFLRGLFHLNLKEFIRDMFSMPVTVGSKNLSWVGTFVALIIWTQGVLGAWYYFKDPIVVFTFGNILYKGLSEFITFNPAAMAAPLSMFSLYMGYLLLKKILAKWSGDI